jgi:AmiR/NasT family two-component response regulator
MTRQSPFSVRGRHALLVMKDERDSAILRRQLHRLGLTIMEADPAEPAPPMEAVDVIMLDTDIIPIRSDKSFAWKPETPIIALVGTETPSRLKWLLDLQPASFLIKPLRSAGIYTALVVAFDCALRKTDEMSRTERLEERLRSRRIVSAAVQQVMRGQDLSEEDAFALIRRAAMRQRVTIEQLSADVVAGGGLPGRTTRRA